LNGNVEAACPQRPSQIDVVLAVLLKIFSLNLTASVIQASIGNDSSAL
jgi:hypothetical protein